MSTTRSGAGYRRPESGGAPQGGGKRRRRSSASSGPPYEADTAAPVRILREAAGRTRRALRREALRPHGVLHVRLRVADSPWSVRPALSGMPEVPRELRLRRQGHPTGHQERGVERRRRVQQGALASVISKQKALVELRMIGAMLHNTVMKPSSDPDEDLPVFSPREYIEHRCTIGGMRGIDALLVSMANGTRGVRRRKDFLPVDLRRECGKVHTKGMDTKVEVAAAMIPSTAGNDSSIQTLRGNSQKDGPSRHRTIPATALFMLSNPG
ncbi:hypothetical protein THAOC_18371 [Thalassiosira oceanica]|uniref:Uncharacterized protein n=1 Tax=Thalassiosira oceanica TaxID=159749 RepID=K0S8I3_THAOC|nr:hypothetical protein THAOC_18371 [Thalassiosira oceanica]|eukprot:EJK61184.1 hypothetical protein THAOC_18371 [Thalassiosira oceanica]